MRAITLGCLVAVATAPAWASHCGCDGPSQEVLRIGSDGSMTLTCQVSKPVFEEKEYAYTVNVPVTVTKKREVNGQVEEYTVTETRPEMRTATMRTMRLVFEQAFFPVDPEKVNAFETDGRKISLADLKKRCQGDTLVVVSGDDAMIPDYYATVFKPGTIVLALPQMHGYSAPAPHHSPAGPAPAAPPPPPAGAPKPQASRAPFVPVRAVSHQTVAAPQEGPQFPASPAPQLVFASREGADTVKIRQFTETKGETLLTLRANDSSVSPEKQMKVVRTVRHSENTLVPWDALRISTPEGGDMSAGRVKERLGAGETTVLLSADGKLVDAFWVQNIKPSVLVFRGVQLSGGMVPYGMPAPAPAPVAYPKTIKPVPQAAPAAPQPPNAT